MELLSLIVTLLTATTPLRFDLDWAAFKDKGDSVRVEFYYGVGFEQLNFQPQENYLAARFRVDFAMNGIDRPFTQSGTVFKRARIRNFQEAISSQRTFVDQFSVTAPPGRYEIKTTIADTLNSGTVVDTITVPDFNNQLALSSVQLGAAIVEDTVAGGFALVPNPGHRFIVGKNRKLYAYFEVYGLEPGGENYQLRYHLIDTVRNDTIFRSEPIIRTKTGTRGATALEISLDSISPGTCRLAVEARDQSRTAVSGALIDFVAEGGTPAATTPYQLQLTPREQKYYRDLQYIATPRELEYYNRLSPEGQEAYLAWFWSKHNLSEFVRRREVVEARFSTARTPGIKTDRGRIYLKYGEPDAVERKTMEMEVKPREYWFYYQLGLTFIFIDQRGDGNYRLAWTNSPDEPETGLEYLLTPEEQNQYK
jgi:GWxTD domain-containing protein